MKTVREALDEAAASFPEAVKALRDRMHDAQTDFIIEKCRRTGLRTLMLRDLAYQAHRIIRAEGTKYEQVLHRKFPVAIPMVECLRPHLKTDCVAVAYNKAIEDFTNANRKS